MNLDVIRKFCESISYTNVFAVNPLQDVPALRSHLHPPKKESERLFVAPRGGRGGEGSNCRVRFVLYGTLSACAHAAAIKLEKRTPGGSERRQGSEGADMKAVAVLVSFNFLVSMCISGRCHRGENKLVFRLDAVSLIALFKMTVRKSCIHFFDIALIFLAIFRYFFRVLCCLAIVFPFDFSLSA